MSVPASASHERPRNWIAALRGFAAAPVAPAERCELCDKPIAAAHPHLIDPESRRFVCACPACAGTVAGGRSSSPLCRVPDDARALVDFRMSDADWDALMIPIGLAFFFTSADGTRVTAMYPGAAGAVESLLDLASWQALVQANPVLEALRPEVEALLVYRVDGAPRHYIAPIDRCYELAGLMRTQWHGFSGGSAVRESIDRFFAELDLRSKSSDPVPCPS